MNNESELFPEKTDWSWNQLPVSESVLELLKYRWIEAKKVFDSECYLCVVFLCGSLLEGVLRGAAEENPEIFNKCNKAPKDKDKVKVKRFQHWILAEFIDVAFDIGLIDLDVQKHSHTLRDFRNYIHPYEQLKHNFKPDKHTANLCFTVLTAAFASLCGERSTNLKKKPDNGITLKKPYQVPSLPRFCVKRSIHHEKIKEKLLNQHSEEGTLLITSIFGLGGIGKSTLAAAIAHEEDVKTYFSDGILWATLGKEPDCLQLLNSWIQELGDYNYKPLKEEDAKRHLQTLLNNKKILIVVDDAWESEHVEYFQVGGNNCRVIVTTRQVFISGVNPYELGVMTESESLELLKSHLQTDLKPSEQDLAKQLAKKVGYLPLALELVACQIANDSTWQELLDYLTEEIARLEYLDIENSTSNEEKRKKYSLEACFNLSLKSLTQEELKQFIWFGILPEDVVITHKMAATLWGVNPEKANQILKRIASKSLLQRGKIEFKEKPTYRIHDLLHDLATKLITAEKNPKQPEKLPGLGLNIIDAHRELLKRYEEKIDSGKWHTLPEDGYINAHLTWHFQKANQNTDIHKLLQEETPDGNNGWYETCNRTGKTAIFINDVRRAWGLAEESWNKTNPSEVVGWQCRYALIITSMNSLVANLPAKLLIALVRENIWTPEQTLSHILQSSDLTVKAHLLTSLVDYLPNDLQESVLSEALSSARQIQDEYRRAVALTALADKLPSELLPEALSTARQIQDEYSRTQALIGLANKLPSVLPEALSSATQIQDEYRRTELLIGLADKLPPELLPEALSTARQIQDEYRRAVALTLVDKLPPELLPEALSIAAQLRSEYRRAEALIGLADKLPSVLPEALSTARQIQDKHSRAQALKALADKLPSVLPEALSTARQIGDEYSRTYALIDLADKLPRELLLEALSIA
ncbi:NB-ARC domain-containing protein, partial [Cylindrospermopsis raciborskii]|uniref:NB-ARC domain-containing protein n=1 Tax=Cylindrospermopsis raciborskii TaxID=77022 RepID=UPI0032B58ABA|nr:hypothetical protein [Cylindrospermopsis raciborskii MVCC19]